MPLWRTIMAIILAFMSLCFIWTGSNNLELSIGHREIVGAFWILLVGILSLVAENGDKR